MLVLGPANARAEQTPASAAWREVGYLNYRGAAPQFEKLREQAEPQSDAWSEATIGLAVCLHHRQPDVKGDKDRAAKLYEEAIDAADGKPVQAQAMLLRARLADQVDYHGDSPDPGKARALYDRILKQWPESPLIHQVALHRAQLAVYSMRRDKVRAGIDEMRSWLERYPNNPLAALQWNLIAMAHSYPLREPAGAVAAYRKAEKSGLPRHVKRDSFYWRLAGLAEQAEDRETAIAYYRRIITEVQRSGFAYESQLRLRELGEEPPPLVNPFAEDQEAGRDEP